MIDADKLRTPIELTFNSPLTEEQIDTITDVDFDYTNHITFYTKHGKEVEFVKLHKGKWLYDRPHHWKCSECSSMWGESHRVMKYCPNCGAEMEGKL